MFVLSLLLIVLTIIALIDVVGQPEPVVRNLPKIVWVLLIVFIPLIGVALWFLLGKDWSTSRIKLPERRRRNTSRSTGSWGPASRPSPSPTQPDRAVSSTEEQLAALEREIQAAEDAERLRKLELELKRDDPDVDDNPRLGSDRS
jgi:hypothetical protein